MMKLAKQKLAHQLITNPSHVIIRKTTTLILNCPNLQVALRLYFQGKDVIAEGFEELRNKLCSFNDNLLMVLLRGRWRPTWGVR